MLISEYSVFADTAITSPISINKLSFVDDFFIFFFGKEWDIAGKYAQILIPSLALKFITNPLSFMLYIAEKQRWNFLIMIFLVLGIIISFLLGDSHLKVVKGISITLTFYYILHLYLSAKLSRAI
jgi:O-antigen/teichoic acid export membrane protein